MPLTNDGGESPNIMNNDDHLDPTTERTAFVTDLVKLVKRIVADGGAPEAEGFDAKRWVEDWLESEVPALGGRTPRSYIETAEGRVIVRRLIMQMESGAYA